MVTDETLKTFELEDMTAFFLHLFTLNPAENVLPAGNLIGLMSRAQKVVFVKHLFANANPELEDAATHALLTETLAQLAAPPTLEA